MGKKKDDADTEFQGKAHAGLGTRAAAQRESDRANRPVPVVHADDFLRAYSAGALTPEALRKAGVLPSGPDPWDGKKRLAAEPKSLRVPFTEDEIRDRRVELEKRIAQTPLLRDQCNAARDAAKVAKDALSAHISQSEGFSAITKQGWQYQDVDCVTVLSGAFAVTYRTDTGEEISRREATTADLQDSIPGV